MIRPTARIILRVGFGAIGALVIVFAAGVWRLSQGPLTLGFLTPYLAAGIRSLDTPLDVAFDDTILIWDRRRGNLSLRIEGVRIRDATGEVISTVPQMSVGVSGQALLRGLLAPSRLELIAPRAHLRRSLDGSFSFGFAGGSAAPETTSDQGTLLLEIVAELLAPPDPERATGWLEEVRVTDADLTVDDQPSLTFWHAPAAQLALARDEEGVVGRLDAAIDVQGQRWRIVADGVYDSDRGWLRLDLDMDGIEPAVLADQSETLSVLDAIRLPVGGRVRLDLGAEGLVSPVRFDLTAGRGAVVLDGLFPEPIEIDRGGLEGRWNPGANELKITRGQLFVGTVAAEAEGTIRMTEEGLAVSADASVRGLPTGDLTKYWPPDRGVNARAWAEENIFGGYIGEAKARLRLAPGVLEAGPLPEGALTVDFTYAGMSTRYLDYMPPVRQLRGQGRLTPSRLDIFIDGGESEGLEVGEGAVLISDLGGDASADLTVVISGGLGTMLELLDREPLALIRGRGLDPAQADGVAAMRGHFAFPLKTDLEFDEIRFAAAANVRDTAIRDVTEELSMTGGTLTLQINRFSMNAEGPVEINGIPLALQWTENFTDDTALRSRFRAGGTVEGTDLARLGLDLGNRVEGPVALSLDVGREAQGPLTVEGTLGLGEAGIEIPEIHWRKAPGVEGEARFAAAVTDNRIRVDDLRIRAGDLVVDGTLTLDDARSIEEATLSRLSFGLTDGTIAATRDPAGVFDIALEARALDLRPYLDDLAGAADEAQNLPPARLQSRIKSVLLYGRERLNEVTLEASYDGARWVESALRGRLRSEAEVTWLLEPSAEGRKFEIASGDAGSVMRALGLYDSGLGGELAITGRIHDDVEDALMEGEVTIEDFRVSNAPVLAQILTLGSFTGINDMLTGDGIAFTRLVAPFRVSNDRLEVTEGRAFGPAIGLTLSGATDIAAATADLTGTIAPAYTLNSALGSLPVVGRLFVPETGGGVFALTYRVSGSLDRPSVTVNPLAALAPGFLRGIVSLFDFSGAPAPSESEQDLPAAEGEPAAPTAGGDGATAADRPSGRRNSP